MTNFLTVVCLRVLRVCMLQGHWRLTGNLGDEAEYRPNFSNFFS